MCVVWSVENCLLQCHREHGRHNLGWLTCAICFAPFERRCRRLIGLNLAGNGRCFCKPRLPKISLFVPSSSLETFVPQNFAGRVTSWRFLSGFERRGRARRPVSWRNGLGVQNWRSNARRDLRREWTNGRCERLLPAAPGRWSCWFGTVNGSQLQTPDKIKIATPWQLVSANCDKNPAC
jgi:hypothetical protein